MLNNVLLSRICISVARNLKYLVISPPMKKIRLAVNHSSQPYYGQIPATQQIALTQVR